MTLVLASVVFAAHLLCVNVAAAGPLIAAGLDWAEGRGNLLAGQAGRYLSYWALGLIVPGVVLGIALGSLLWTPEYGASVARLWSKVFFGIWEIVFSVVLMALHAWWWRKRPQLPAWQRGVRMFIALLASTNLLYHFPTLFAILETVATQEASGGETITAAAFRSRLAHPLILARTLHFILAAVATCGIVLFGFALRQFKIKRGSADAERAARWGARIALIATALQIPVGLWLTAVLPPSQQSLLMGGSWWLSAAFFLSLALAFWLLQMLSTIALGDVERRPLVQSMAVLAALILLMSGVLQALRAAQMSP